MHLWVSQLRIDKIPIHVHGSLSDSDFMPNCMAFKLAIFYWWKHARPTQQ
jgi:hypothetical protein